MRDATAIIVGSNKGSRASLRRFLKTNCGLGTVSEVGDGKGGLNYLEQSRFDLVFLDRETISTFDRGLIRSASRTNGRVPIVVVTLLKKLAAFVNRLTDRTGGSGRGGKLENAALGQLLEFARKRGDLALASNAQSGSASPGKPVGRNPSHLFDLMGRSETVERLVERVGQVGPTKYSVLVVGETGTGKELIARAIHAASPRASRPFVALDCGAISDTLVESELFGHVEGAFTGAERERPGKFRMADNGTLFLDEVSTMSRNMQGSVLRALERNAFYAVGGSEEVEVDTRVIAASNRDVRGEDGFRDDLYFRLAEYVIEVPPLRFRKEDIPFLAHRFVEEANAELPHDVTDVAPETVDLLQAYEWPGNVRELRNVVRQGALAATHGTVEPSHIDPDIKHETISAPEIDPELPDDNDVSLKEIVQDQKAEIERKVIRQVMEQTDGNMAETARKLNVDYKTIYKKVREYGILSDFE